jgi:hypothetical protein
MALNKGEIKKRGRKKKTSLKHNTGNPFPVFQHVPGFLLTN